MACTFTQHAQIRMKQRGVCQEAISFIEKYGTVHYVPGGVKKVTLLKKKKDKIIKELKRTISIIEKASKLVVIQGKNKIITVYYK